MHRKTQPLILLAIILLVSLLSACSSEPESGGSSDREELDSVSGRIARVELDTRRFVLKPQGEDVIVLIFNPESLKPTLDGEEVEPDAIAVGQRAEVEYFVNDNDRYVARTVELRSAPSTVGGPDNEETTLAGEETT